MQVFFPYAILVFQIFWQKIFYRSQIGAISSKEKRSPLLCSVEEWSEIVKQLSTEKLFILNLENRDLEPKFTTWNPNWEFEREGWNCT